MKLQTKLNFKQKNEHTTVISSMYTAEKILKNDISLNYQINTYLYLW